MISPDNNGNFVACMEKVLEVYKRPYNPLFPVVCMDESPGSFYEASLPPRAKQLWDRFEFVFTPKHGSWLNMAEIELNVLTGQCLNRRIDNIDDVRRETTAWQKYRNNHKSNVN